MPARLRQQVTANYVTRAKRIKAFEIALYQEVNHSPAPVANIGIRRIIGAALGVEI